MNSNSMLFLPFGNNYSIYIMVLFEVKSIRRWYITIGVDMIQKFVYRVFHFLINLTRYYCYY